MSDTMYDKDFFIDFLKDTFEERKDYLENNCSILDIENMACDLYYGVTKQLSWNITDDFGESCCNKERELLKEILLARLIKLESNFAWTEVYKKQLVELNDKVMESFTKAYDEAKMHFRILKDRMNSNDHFVQGFNIDIVLKPFILELNEEEFYLEERGKGIYYLLYNIIPDILWSDDIYYEHDLEEEKEKKYIRLVRQPHKNMI